MKYWDISLPFYPDMVVWPGDVRFEHHEKKTSAIVSRLVMSSHHGTHVDAPRHFLFNTAGVDSIGMAKLVGTARIIRLRSKNLITVADLRPLRIKAHDKILFQTRNQTLYRKPRFVSDYVSLSLEAARYLAKQRIDLVGIDYYGIEAKSAPGHPVHKVLMRAGIVIVEGLNLGNLKPGVYQMAILPLKIRGGDAAPARAVLWK